MSTAAAAAKKTGTVVNFPAHTSAVGVDPYDKTYSLGYEVGHKDWSPYPRVNHLRQTFLDRQFDIDLERLRLITDTYKTHPDASPMMLTALSFENILLNVSLHIYDEDLILGEIAAPAKAAPVYPEFSVNWIIDEVLHSPFEEREHDQFYLRNDDDRKEIVELCRYWQGKTVDDLINERLTDEQVKGSEACKRIYMTNLYHFAGVGHLVLDYAKLMKVGYGGLIAEVEEKRDALDQNDPDYASKKEYYDATLISLNAVVKYIERYAKLAEEYAAKETDPARKAELETMAANCHQIAAGPAKTFWQAMQLFNFATTLVQIESNGHSISYGRMDQWLYPYYKADMDNGVISKEFAQELIEVEFVKMNNPTKLKDKSTVEVRSGRGFGGECLTIGGVDTKGNDATNDLTFMILDGSVHTRMMNPWVLVRMHEGTPYELKVKTVECIRAGYGHPKIFNDGPTVKLMMKKGMTLEEARDYAVVGCVEPDLPGKEYGFHDAEYVNTVKMLEMTINGGRCLDCGPHCPRWSKCGALGKHLGPDTGNLADYKSFDEVLESFDKQIAYWADMMCSTEDVIDVAQKERKPLPYASAFFEHCLETGKDLSAGGAKYNSTGPQASGLATCADSLASIKQLVFEEKRYTGAELLQAVKDNWKGHQALYALVNSKKVHHYGNDDDYADDLFKWIFDKWCGHIAGRKNARGGEFRPGVYSVNANVGMGLYTNASLDGRKAGEPISDNMGPVHTAGGSHDVCGPTAIANSVAKMDHSKATNGTLLNLKFPPEAVAGVEGRDNLVNYISAYVAKQNMHVQFNIMSSKTMRAAQKHPEDYKDMLVRVAGYSAYFVELGKALQQDLISRTELSFS